VVQLAEVDRLAWRYPAGRGDVGPWPTGEDTGSEYPVPVAVSTGPEPLSPPGGNSSTDPSDSLGLADTPTSISSPRLSEGQRTVDDNGNWSEQRVLQRDGQSPITLRIQGDATGTWEIANMIDADGAVLRSTYAYNTPDGRATVQYDSEGSVIGRQFTPADGSETLYFIGNDQPTTPEAYGELLAIANLEALGELDGDFIDTAGRGRAARAPDAADRVFTIERLRSLPTLDVKGAGDARLSQAMYALMPPRDPDSGMLVMPTVDDPKVEQALATVAEVRGISNEKAREDYAKYRIFALRAEEAAVRQGQTETRFAEGAAGEHRVPGLSSSVHGLVPGAKPGQFMQDHHRHMGSIDQLRFGTLVGDSLGGIDPVFGALLSPTGGIPGAGNNEIGNAAYLAGGGRDVVTLHGTAHDAAGYLRNYQNLGPGYNYVPGARAYLGDTNPLAGQLNGLDFYYKLIRYGDPYYKPPLPAGA
jgi:hypothetical protein